MASFAVFAPQSKAPTEQYLARLRHFLIQNVHLQQFLQHVLKLTDTWNTVASQRPDIAALAAGPRHTQNLAEWIASGKSQPIANTMSGILSLPLLTIIQIGQYFQYLQARRLRHADMLHHLRANGGFQGYCGGLLPAIAVACSRDESEVAQNAAKAMRIALAIGAYSELGDDESIPGGTTMVVRVKQPGQAEELVKDFSGVSFYATSPLLCFTPRLLNFQCYISATTDPKTVSVVGPVLALARLQTAATERGFLCQTMHIRGKCHNPENAELAAELRAFCSRHEEFRLPTASELQAPVRSNLDGLALHSQSLSDELVTTILAAKCEWWKLINYVAQDLAKVQRKTHEFVTFGIGECVPLAPFHQLQLQMHKTDALSVVEDVYPNAYKYPKEAVAIIGASCRLPGANDLDELWDLVSEARSTHQQVPKERIDLHGSFRASQDEKYMSKRTFYGNFIDDPDAFDNNFFGTNAKEAASMDPQQRILLELAFQAMESSGYLGRHRRKAGDPYGCFIGASFVEYLENTNSHAASAYTSTGTIRAFLAGRISYHFGWTGPAEVLDTACSSSLVAINRAVKAVQTGECPVALSGGIGVMSGITNFIDLGKAGFLSPTGQCKPFCQSADGYCRSEGGGLVVLKLLNKALEDCDPILGVLAGSSTNQGGLSAAITIPHSEAQINLYRTVLRQAGMTAEQVTYVEAHGTGTQAGDPLEVASIREVFGGANRTIGMSLGSIKGNIGHCETGAGVAGLLKVLAMMKKRSIPPQAHHKTLNPKIPALEADQMRITLKKQSWNAPLLASLVNSYGAAGSNAAVICVEGPPHRHDVDRKDRDSTSSEQLYPIILSAANQPSLRANILKLRKYLETRRADILIGDLAFTLSSRRGRQAYKLFTSASSIPDLIETLEKNESTAGQNVPRVEDRKPVVMAFGGQSKQTVGLSKRVYDEHPHFRDMVDACDALARSMGVAPLLPSIFETEQPVEDVAVLQCGTFAVQFAAAQCWTDAGLPVDAVVGHSFGELTGLVVSGVLSLRDGMRVVATRAQLMAARWGPERGAMMNIFASPADVEKIVANSRGFGAPVEIACINAANSTVVVGSHSDIGLLEKQLQESPDPVRHQRVDVTHGFHSRFTEPLLNELDEVAGQATFNKPIVHLETCTQAALNDTIPPSHVANHARQTVFFQDAISRLENRLGKACIWLEAGFNTPIIPMVKRALKDPASHVLTSMRTESNSLITDTVMSLWQQGIPVSHWNFINAHESGLQQQWLPPYEFLKSSHWISRVDRAIEALHEAANVPEATATAPPPHPKELVTPKNIDTAKQATSTFNMHLETSRFTSIVSGHAVRQRPLCPAALYLEAVTGAIQLLFGEVRPGSIQYEHVDFLAPLGVDYDREVELVLETVDLSVYSFIARSTRQSDQKKRVSVHAKGQLRINGPCSPAVKSFERMVRDSVTQLEQRRFEVETLMSKRAYALFSRVVTYAGFLKGISQISLDGTQALANVRLPPGEAMETWESPAAHLCDTVPMDMFIQVLGLLINSSPVVGDDEVYVATGLEQIWTSPLCKFDKQKSWLVYVKFSSLSDDQAVGDIIVFTTAMEVCMTITGSKFTKLTLDKLEKLLDSANPRSSGSEQSQLETKNVPVSKTTPTVSSDPDTPPELVRSTTGGSSAASPGPMTPDSMEFDTSELKRLIASFSGIAEKDISEDALIGELGVDSLAAVELAEEFQSRFGQEVDADDLLVSSCSALAKLVGPSVTPPTTSAAKVSASTSTSAECKRETETAVTQVACDKSLGKLYKILGDACGVDLGPNPDQSTTLDALGVDSLSAVELKSDLEDAFSVSIDDDALTLESTLADVIKEFGVSGTAPTASANIEQDNSPHDPLAAMPQTAKESRCTLPNPHAVLSRTDDRFPESATARGFARYWNDVAPLQNQLLLAYICDALTALDCDLSRMSPGQVLPKVKHLPKHEKVMQRFMDILEDHGVVVKHGNDYARHSGTLPSNAPQQIHDKLVSRSPQYTGEANLMALTGTKLAECLSGKTDAVALMFRNPASQKIMEEYYCNSPMLSTMTEQLVVFMKDMLTNVRADVSSPVRICEVGAGFGGTTTRLAEVIEQAKVSVEYTFTDIAPMLVKRAKEKFKKYQGWMAFQTLNLESNSPDNMRGKYDIILGTNCVHATSSRAGTTSKLRELLSDQGFIILSEVTEMVDWYDLTFGLLEGWWLAEGGTQYPLQPPSEWMKSFKDAGYASSSFSRGASKESESQRLLIASRRQSVSNSASDYLPKVVSSTSKNGLEVRTVCYKEVGGIDILADVYLPLASSEKRVMPIGTLNGSP